MNKSIIISIFYLFLTVENETLTEGIYEIKYKDFYLKIHHKNKHLIILSNQSSFQASSSFRIKKASNNINDSYFIIENLRYNLKLYSKENQVILNSRFVKKDTNFFWLIIKKNENLFLIMNKNGCYIKLLDSNKVICINSNEEASEFSLIEIYEEVNHTKEDIKLIENEPIDVLIKYIDLRDKNLKRKGIHQIKKDLDNEELRYSIRSILKNIPWIRKIFILMPNEKVRYFKELKEIEERIVYVKDKNLIGFDSSSIYVFQFRYWKMKYFNISDNFICMDDDYYIGRPLKKTDLFYVKDNKVVPLIITSRFLTFNKEQVEKNIYYYKQIIKKSKEEQTFSAFQYSKQLSYLFIMKVLSKKEIIVPKFTHNAIPTNVNEIKQIYDLINESQFKNATLYSNYRHIDSLQFQSLILGYTFIKYRKKIKNISSKLIRFRDSLFSNYNYDLFCVNTNSQKNSILSNQIFKIVMENLFPKKSPYEIIDYSLSSLALDIIKQMVIKNNYFEKELIKINKRKINLNNLEEKKNKLSKALIYNEEKLSNALKRKMIVFYPFLILITIIILKKLYNNLSFR